MERNIKLKEELHAQEKKVQKLDQARSEQIKCSDKKIQRLESEICKLLQISPESYKLHKFEELEQIQERKKEEQAKKAKNLEKERNLAMERCTKLKEELHAQEKKVQKLGELDKVQSAQIKHADEKIQMLESQVYKFLQISPESYKLHELEQIHEKRKEEQARKAKNLEQERDLEKERNAKLKEEFHTQKEEVQKLRDLNRAQSEKIKHADEKVQRVESKICELLQISPKSWILEERLFGEVISKLEAQCKISGQIQALMKSRLTSSDVKVLFRLLVEESEPSQLVTSDKSSSASKYSHHITDLESFIIFLKEVLVDARNAELSYSPKTLAINISMAIHHLQCHYRLKYENVLITILVYPYQNANFDGVITLKPISVEDLESLQKQFSEQRIKFNKYLKKQPLHLQAYLFHLAVGDHCSIACIELLRYIGEIMMHLQPPLEPDLLKSLNAYLIRGSTLETFKADLHSLMTSSIRVNQEERPLPSSKTKHPHSLKSVLGTTKQINTIVTNPSSVFKNNPEVCNLLEKLGLCKHYPKGLRMQDALCIRPEPLRLSLKETPPTDPKQLPFLILQKLMSYDSLCRSELMSAGKRDLYSSHYKDDSSDDSDEDEFSDSSDDSDEDEFGVNSNGIHPVDSLLALILCSDDFLRQDLFSRLAKCQLAVPFLLPDPFTKQLTLPLWAMRSIIKEWKCTNEDGEIVQQTHPIVSYEMPIVSFMRFGKHQKYGASKSKILNEVISDSNCDHFFHRDCPGGQRHHLFGEGLVDMCWYLPAGKPSDTFPDAVTFLNLHGDGRDHLVQSRFLSQISSMCFILLTEEDLKFESEAVEIFCSSPSGMTILNDADKIPALASLKKAIPRPHIINLSRKNSSQISFLICKRIKKNMEKLNKSIETICNGIREEGILVDESSNPCKNGINLAKGLMNIVTISKEKEPNLKDAMLPLQGSDMWKAWAANEKELYRQTQRGKKKVNHYTADIQSDKRSIRDKQLGHINSLTSLMESFIVSLLQLRESSNTTLRYYFLKCLKLELDNLSREKISEMKHQYKSVRIELSAKDDSDEGEVKFKSDKLKKELENLQEDSFGLEHLFRELGQVYEAALESGDYGKNLSCLPKVAAELFIDGYPLELMDGDAAHVPLLWVTAVLRSAVEMLGDPKIFVLSVLGLQSTGKSTMLNTAFGLQFNVSAGRCTRGAFMQLLSLDEELRQRIKCEYVLVVDTEGLRAPELDPLKTQKHDNELATFVIGLANTTLINIYGEVAGDMDDILQISVHAFLRMIQVKFNPSCQFVHQNAGASIYCERNKFTQKLDQIILDAAREENCEGQFKSFNDVIKFNDQTDVHHFPGLWKGDPPMAPVNRGYSQSAQMLKKHIIECIYSRATEKDAGYLYLSSFVVKINDLWVSLLKEKFVFCFKNTLEIIVYNSLETAYSKWEWTFTEAMLKWEQKVEDEICAAPLRDVPALVEDKCRKLEPYVSEQIKPLKYQMNEFFNGKESDILVQWKAMFERRLKIHSLELKLLTEQHCVKLGKSREAITKFESRY